MSRPEEADIAALLRELVQAGVEFVVIGGAAAVLHGAPITTRDLDIVPERSPANSERLAGVLRALGATVRDPAGRQIEPRVEWFRGPGQILLSTRLGPLDVLGSLHDGRGYLELAPRAVLLRNEEITIRVIDLPALIEIKIGAGRAKDRLLVPMLMALQMRRGES